MFNSKCSFILFFSAYCHLNINKRKKKERNRDNRELYWPVPDRGLMEHGLEEKKSSNVFGKLRIYKGIIQLKLNINYGNQIHSNI